jgi:hypothetical protein
MQPHGLTALAIFIQLCYIHFLFRHKYNPALSDVVKSCPVAKRKKECIFDFRRKGARL